MKRWMIVAIVMILCAPLAMAQTELSIFKRPYEEIDISYNFATCNCLGSSAITLVSVTASNSKTGVSTTSSVIADSPVPAIIPATSKVGFRLKGGSTGETHTIVIRATVDDTGEKLEGRITLRVGDEIR